MKIVREMQYVGKKIKKHLLLFVAIMRVSIMSQPLWLYVSKTVLYIYVVIGIDEATS